MSLGELREQRCHRLGDEADTFPHIARLEDSLTFVGTHDELVGNDVSRPSRR